MPRSPQSLPDLTDRDGIVLLVNRFYDRIRADDQLGPIFSGVAKVNWESHLPRMYDFWDTVMFRSGTFRGNPLTAHARLVPLTDMSRAKFDHWLDLFRATVAELFAGENAGHIVRCAEDMANVLHSRIHNLRDTRFDPDNLTEKQRQRYASYKPSRDSL